MDLPPLSALEFLVVHLLFVGPQSAAELRRTLESLGVRRSQPSFSRTMIHLDWKGYVFASHAARPGDGQTVRQRRYEVTDLGVLKWLQTRKFYENLAPPSPDLVPRVSELADGDAYDREIRDQFDRDSMSKHLMAAFRRIQQNPKGFSGLPGSQ